MGPKFKLRNFRCHASWKGIHGALNLHCSSYISKIVWWLPMFDFGIFCRLLRLMGIYRLGPPSGYLKNVVLSFLPFYLFFLFFIFFFSSLSGAPGHCPPMPPSRYATGSVPLSLWAYLWSEWRHSSDRNRILTWIVTFSIHLEEQLTPFESLCRVKSNNSCSRFKCTYILILGVEWHFASKSILYHNLFHKIIDFSIVFSNW